MKKLFYKLRIFFADSFFSVPLNRKCDNVAQLVEPNNKTIYMAEDDDDVLLQIILIYER